MCAIFGIGFLKGHKVYDNVMISAILKKLFRASDIRGGTASGISYIFPHKIRVIKKNMSANRLIDTQEFIDLKHECLDMHSGNLLSIVGHCRLKTKGSEIDNENNHPIVRDNIIGVHNGIISNDEILFDLHRNNFRRNGRVDSEIIFALIEHYVRGDELIHESICRAISVLNGTMACAMVHNTQPHIVWLFRKFGPCDVRIFHDVGIVMWSSSVNFITESIEPFKSEIGYGKVIDVPCNGGIAIDLHRNLINKFNTDEQNTQHSEYSSCLEDYNECPYGG